MFSSTTKRFSKGIEGIESMKTQGYLFMYTEFLRYVFNLLAESLKTEKGKHILFLGASASLSSDGKTAEEIVKDIVRKYRLNPRNPWNSFYYYLREAGLNEQYSILSPYFKGTKLASGYKILSKLIEQRYFRLVLTTNFGFMLEKALSDTSLVLNKDYFVCTFGAEKESVLIRKLEDESKVRLVKLHGDYKTRILSFAEEDTLRFGNRFETWLKEMSRASVIFVGYSEMDRDILDCLSHKGESVWWVNPKKVTADKTLAENSGEYLFSEEIYRVLINRESHNNFIWGEQGRSDNFFEEIFQEISTRDIDSFCDKFKLGATRYKKMKDLFEPPYQYEEMKRKLNRYGILLILGEAHIGKTYTALNLLFDYFVEGFNVVYISELSRKEMQYEMLYKWEDILKPDTVVYFEDPFGKTEPENARIFRSELKRPSHN